MIECRVNFCRDIMGVPFEVGSIEIRRARDISRARRAAELKFARRRGVPDWRTCADVAEVAIGELRGS